MKKLVIGLLVLVAILAAAWIAYAATQTHGPVTSATADSYSSTGDTISGWDWLRDSSYSDQSVYTFNNLPRKTKDGKIYVKLDFLVTNKVSGGSGYSTTIKVYFLGAKTKKDVKLRNLTPIKDPNYTVDGFGYGANGQTWFVAKKVPANGTVNIVIKRKKGLKYHVATNQGALQLMWH